MKASRIFSFVSVCIAAILTQGPSLVKCSADDFPSFDIFHSHCALSVVIPGQLCYDVYSQLKATLVNFNAGGDPSGGVYKLKEEQAISYVWTLHDSRKGWYSDVIFEPTQVGNDC